MRPPADDTIAAISTAPGRGGIGIVRVSGPACATIALGIARPRADAASARRCVASATRSGGTIDVGLALFFAAPRSYTGEDVLELHGHGGPVVMDLLLARVLELGARAAAPGEFTQRAFLNDKLDLAQAEAVADLIDSGSAQAARAAVRSLDGEFSDQVRELSEAVLQLRHVGRGRHRLPGGGDRLSRRSRARRPDARPARAFRRGSMPRRGRVRCCATG